MSELKVLVLTLLLTGCGCGLQIGDTVIDKLTDEVGVVDMIYSGGDGTKECKIAVRYSDRREYWVYGFHFKLEKGEQAMVIDLTVLFDGVHLVWDVIGFAIGASLIIGLCVVIPVASGIKVYEYLQERGKRV